MTIKFEYKKAKPNIKKRKKKKTKKGLPKPDKSFMRAAW